MSEPVTFKLLKSLAWMDKPARYKVAYGGRGSGKSWGFADALLLMALERKVRILCAREVQKSIKDSVHRLLGDRIEAMGLSGKFNVLRDEIRCVTGSQFLFSGLANTTIDSIKSFEGVDICWVEEAQSVSEQSWEILIPTIREPGSEIWISFNPSETTDPTYVRFVLKPPPDAMVHKINWDSNPFFPVELQKEKDYLYSTDPEAAEHVWGGGCRRVTDAQILRGRYRVQSFDPVPGLWDGPYQGIDFGFAKDPGVLSRVWIWEHDLYVEWEAWGLEVETDLLPSLWDLVPAARDYIARADNARPETISQVKRLGYKRVVACKKWPGSVKDGIEFLRSFQSIIIHPRCVQTAIEARLWSWKTDRLSGDVMPEPIDKNNHCWDAIRYALEPIILHGLAEKVPEVEDEEFPGLRQSSSWMG